MPDGACANSAPSPATSRPFTVLCERGILGHQGQANKQELGCLSHREDGGWKEGCGAVRESKNSGSCTLKPRWASYKR
jgi:hypothetical protein